MTRTTPKDWTELDPKTLQRALDGNRAAFEALYRHYAGIVRGAVAARLRAWPRLDLQLEDVLNEVWVQMLADDRRVLRLYDPRRGPFGYFIKLVAASRASSLVRRRTRHEPLPLSAAPEGEARIERALLQRDFIESLWALVRPRLKEVDEELFMRVMVGGEETKDVAPELGLKQDAAYQRIARLRARLVRLATELLQDGHPSRRSRNELVQAIVTQALLLLVGSSTIETEPAPRSSTPDVNPEHPST